MKHAQKRVVFALAAVFVILLNVSVIEAWRKYVRKPSKFIGPRSKFRRTIKIQSSKDNTIQPRIFGGRPARFGEAPYYLRMQAYEGFHCGASLLNHRGVKFAITAGHCVWEGERNLTHATVSVIPPNFIQVVGADLNKDKFSKEEQWFDVQAVFLHEQFDPRNWANDVALLFLHRYAFESFGLEHVPLPGAGWEPPEFVNIVGHGAKLRLDYQAELQVVELETVPNDICNATLEHLENLSRDKPTEFCVGHPISWTIQGVCFGDSGGPVVAFNYTTQSWYLAGVVSYSPYDLCGQAGAITAIQKVSSYVGWIYEKAEDWLLLFGTGNPYTNGTPEDRRRKKRSALSAQPSAILSDEL